jgi:hypothetical protein
MSAPERIWAEPFYSINPDGRFWDDDEWHVSLEPDGTAIEWVRADLHDTLRAERDALAARVERLEGALRWYAREAKPLANDDPWYGGNPVYGDLGGEIVQDAGAHARAALSTDAQ